MKKGFSLLEVLVSLMLLSVLLVCVGIIFVKGLKLKVVADQKYEAKAALNEALNYFDSLWKYYQKEELRLQGNYLIVGEQIIFSFDSQKLLFYYDGVAWTVEGVQLIDIRINERLLEVFLENNNQVIRRDYYYGGGV